MPADSSALPVRDQRLVLFLATPARRQTARLLTPKLFAAGRADRERSRPSRSVATEMPSRAGRAVSNRVALAAPRRCCQPVKCVAQEQRLTTSSGFNFGTAMVTRKARERLQELIGRLGTTPPYLTVTPPPKPPADSRVSFRQGCVN
jgi:hypothetical protein